VVFVLFLEKRSVFKTTVCSRVASDSIIVLTPEQAVSKASNGNCPITRSVAAYGDAQRKLRIAQFVTRGPKIADERRRVLSAGCQLFGRLLASDLH
jgi:hypothetical protein